MFLSNTQYLTKAYAHDMNMDFDSISLFQLMAKLATYSTSLLQDLAASKDLFTQAFNVRKRTEVAQEAVPGSHDLYRGLFADEAALLCRILEIAPQRSHDLLNHSELKWWFQQVHLFPSSHQFDTVCSVLARLDFDNSVGYIRLVLHIVQVHAQNPVVTQRFLVGLSVLIRAHGNLLVLRAMESAPSFFEFIRSVTAQFAGPSEESDLRHHIMVFTGNLVDALNLCTNIPHSELSSPMVSDCPTTPAGISSSMSSAAVSVLASPQTDDLACGVCVAVVSKARVRGVRDDAWDTLTHQCVSLLRNNERARQKAALQLLDSLTAPNQAACLLISLVSHHEIVTELIPHMSVQLEGLVLCSLIRVLTPTTDSTAMYAYVDSLAPTLAPQAMTASFCKKIVFLVLQPQVSALVPLAKILSNWLPVWLFMLQRIETSDLHSIWQRLELPLFVQQFGSFLATHADQPSAGLERSDAVLVLRGLRVVIGHIALFKSRMVVDLSDIRQATEGVTGQHMLDVETGMAGDSTQECRQLWQQLTAILVDRSREMEVNTPAGHSDDGGA
jgi:hypothetical protein